MKTLPTYKYNGARSLVLLHEAHMKSFLNTWKKAKAANIKLPETDDEDYQSLETLLFHVLRASKDIWFGFAQSLTLPIPKSTILHQ